MKFNYEEHSLKPGIYKILNTHTNRIYIGQAKRFKERWMGHRSSLRRNKCMNHFFLNDYNKCKAELGHDDFLEFHVLDVMEGSTKEERNKREEEWIEKFYDKQQNCYNLKQKVESTFLLVF
jgi:group I intron endonuclease